MQIIVTSSEVAVTYEKKRGTELVTLFAPLAFKIIRSPSSIIISYEHQV